MTSKRDNALWLKLWRNHDTDFHQTSINDLLIRFWAKFDLKQNSRVFIPLCGKSLDMLWLRDQGHTVIGIELSPVAIKEFFAENNLDPIKTRIGQFTVWQHDNISILCGDFFDLTKEDLGHIDTVYDRAALTALPEDLRQPYVKHLKHITPNDCDVFLLTTEDIEHTSDSDKTPFIDKEIQQLYSLNFDICLKHVENIAAFDLLISPESDSNINVSEYRLYQLSHKSILSLEMD